MAVCCGRAFGVGAVIGGLLASRVAMTSMPELVAVLHSFVGAAAVLVGISTYLQPGAEIEAARGAHLIEIFIGIPWAPDLQRIDHRLRQAARQDRSKPLLLPGRHLLNATVLLACVALGVIFFRAQDAWPNAEAGGSLLDAACRRCSR